MDINLGALKKVYCIGIGGIGVSALARMLQKEGIHVSGSDVHESEITRALHREKISVHIGHNAKYVNGADCVIYTKAIASDNPELVYAKKNKIPAFTYAEALGALTKIKFTIAVSGTHGKTTTTAMIGNVLHAARLHPTIIVGGVMANFGSNFVSGKGKYCVVEACEYKRSFLDLSPRIVVITNIDRDHLDYYKDLKDIQSAFRELVLKLGVNDMVVCNPNDPRIRPVLRKVHCRVMDYTTAPKIPNMHVFGSHNIENAKVAYTVSQALGINAHIVRHALQKFKGVGRRFEYKGTIRGVKFYDDYAHHPTEIQAALSGARAHFGKKKKIWVVFQPHLYSRTKLLLKEFSESFDAASCVLLSDIYAAREKDDGTIHAKDLAKKIEKRTYAHYLGSFDVIAEFLRAHMKKGDVVVTMGAGEAFQVFSILKKKAK